MGLRVHSLRTSPLSTVQHGANLEGDDTIQGGMLHWPRELRMGRSNY